MPQKKITRVKISFKNKKANVEKPEEIIAGKKVRTSNLPKQSSLKKFIKFKK